MGAEQNGLRTTNPICSSGARGAEEKLLTPFARVRTRRSLTEVAVCHGEVKSNLSGHRTDTIGEGGRSVTAPDHGDVLAPMENPLVTSAKCVGTVASPDPTAKPSTTTSSSDMNPRPVTITFMLDSGIACEETVIAMIMRHATRLVASGGGTDNVSGCAVSVRIEDVPPLAQGFGGCRDPRE